MAENTAAKAHKNPSDKSMSEENDKKESPSGIKKGIDQLTQIGSQLASLIRFNTEKTRDQVRDILYSTSDQVLEKAEETRKAVKLRMAIMEIEHHLNRLYPQIGKMTCDLAAEGKKQVLSDSNLTSQIDMAKEYRERLTTLRQELKLHQESGKA